MPVPKLVLGSPAATSPDKVERTPAERTPRHSADVFGTDYYKVTTAARRAPRTTARAGKVRVRYTFAAALERRLAEIEANRQRSVTEHAAPGIPASRVKRVKPEPLPKVKPEPRSPGDVGTARWVDTVARLDDAPYAGRRLRPEQLPDQPNGFAGARITDPADDQGPRRERFLARAESMNEERSRKFDGWPIDVPDDGPTRAWSVYLHYFDVPAIRRGERALCGFAARRKSEGKWAGRVAEPVDAGMCPDCMRRLASLPVE